MKRHVILFVLVFSYLVGYSQISTEENPVSFQYTQSELTKFSKPAPGNRRDVKILRPPDVNALQQEDKQDEQNGLPPRFGVPILVNFSLQNSGNWMELPNGDKLWQLEIQSKGALSLNLLYDKFWLPEGSKFFIYSKKLV